MKWRQLLSAHGQRVIVWQFSIFKSNLKYLLRANYVQKANCYGGDESVCDKSFPSNVYELLKHIREHSILNSFHESTLLYSTQYLACTFFWYYYYSFLYNTT